MWGMYITMSLCGRACCSRIHRCVLGAWEEEEEEEFITSGNWRGKHKSLSRGVWEEDVKEEYLLESGEGCIMRSLQFDMQQQPFPNHFGATSIDQALLILSKIESSEWW